MTNRGVLCGATVVPGLAQRGAGPARLLPAEQSGSGGVELQLRQDRAAPRAWARRHRLKRGLCRAALLQA